MAGLISVVSQQSQRQITFLQNHAVSVSQTRPERNPGSCVKAFVVLLLRVARVKARIC